MATYGSAGGVQALVPGVGTLSASTTPTADQVTQWLAEGYAVINRAVASAGYVVPVENTAAVYAELTALNNLYAAAYVKRALGIDLATGASATDSSEQWLRQFDSQLKSLSASNLAALGATVAAATGSASQRRRRVRTMQLRRVDGFSGAHEGAVAEYDHTSE